MSVAVAVTAEQATDLRITYKGKVYNVPVGFTVDEYVESIISCHPEAQNSQLIHEKDGEYTLKALYAEKG
jgi:calcineurin-like phosphoesterase